MRQGDDADLIGPDDSCRSCIGMVYVAPDDNKPTVLTAILTQYTPNSTQLAVDHNAYSILDNGQVYWRVQPQIDLESQVSEDISPNGTLVRNDGGTKSVYSNGAQNKADPNSRFIPLSSAASGSKTTREISLPSKEAAVVPIVISELFAQPNGSNAAPSTSRGNTGMMPSVSAGGGVGAAIADRVASGRGGHPPTANAPGGPGGGSGGVGGSRRRTRQQLAILLIVLTFLLVGGIGGITIATIPGGFNNLPHVIPGTTATATVTITPDSKDVTNTFRIVAVTNTPNPNLREVSARILTATSPTQSKTVTTTSVVQQSDIDGAANSLAALLTPGTLAALQKQVHSNEQVVPNTLRCTSAVSANHAAGDHASNVTVIVSVTCKEEVYDQQAALMLGANLLAKQASTDLGPNYALMGNIVAEVTRVTVVDTKGTLSILVRAEGVWVYQFSNTVLQGFANHVANMSNQDAIHYLMSQPGVKAVKIDNPNGNTMPDTAHIKFVIVAIPGATGTPTTGRLCCDYGEDAANSTVF